MLTAFIKFGDGRISTYTDSRTLAAAVRDPKAVFWLDMNKPDEEELALLDDVFGFHPLAIEDTIQYSQRPKIESYNHIGDACQQGYFYMVIHGPDLETFREKLRTKELDMFVSERYLVTIHEEPHRSISELLNRAKSDPRVVLDPGIDLLLHSILDKLVDNYTPILDHMQEEIDTLEEKAASDPTPELLPKITVQKRELLNLRRIIGPQREVIAQLTRGEVPFIRETTRVYLRDVLDHLVRAVEMIELYRDLVIGARDVYLSSISNNLNQIMKTLTIITVCALPATIITSFYGMNFEGVPGFNNVLHSPAGFWVSMLGTVALILFLLYLFHRRKWL
ncbi:MAG TPA: magnesium/cobalt transporter CorA [Tepidisphaeraceae bacterium]|nr:magnesium/cobalt transporter CorA [Tepidisphaeraceae bacterium]